ncbi:MAG: hypothetical protein ABIF45_01550 [Pseudomonadota bacterium]
MDDQPIKRLFDCPDIAREVGFLMMQSANLEIWLVPVLSKITDEVTARAIIRKIDNISAKLSILFEIAENRPDDDLARRIASIRDDVEKAVAYRNSLAHSLFAFDGDDLHLVRNVVSDRRGKPKFEPLDPSEIRRHAENISKAISTILGSEGKSLNLLVPRPPPKRA